MRIGYLINVYPRPNQSFIWREMSALESMGHSVFRFALRRCDTVIADNERREADQTRYVLEEGFVGLILAMLGVALSHPLRFLSALGFAIRLGWRGERGVLRHLAYLAEACVLRRWLIDSEADHIHAHYGTNTATIAMLCRELGGAPFSFTAHGPEEFDKPEAIALEEKIDRAAFVVAVSSFGRSQLLRVCPYAQWNKVHVVHCGVDEMFLKADLSPFPTEPRLISVGRLSAQKGQHLLIEAAAKLVAEGMRFELLVVGDGEMRDELQSLIEQLDLTDTVRLIGWRANADVRSEILRCRALIMPSFAEGLPVAIMESLALRRPVVSTGIAGTPELVRDGVSGYLIAPGSIEELADGIRKVLLERPEKLEEMGATGSRAVRTHHDSRIEAARLARLFQSNSQSNPVEAAIPESLLAAD
jgi:colanic acid/amylovoran biosynthesis glycosyltransferase